jgi:NhaP-type Na+/H+ or K+/H+ antiporter
VQGAFWTAAVSATIILIAAVLALTAKQSMIDLQVGKQGQTLTPDQIRSAITLQVWMLVGVSLILGLVIVWLARQVREGERKARTRFAIASGVLVLFLFFFGNLISLLGILILLVSLAMMFLPKSTEYLKSEL